MTVSLRTELLCALLLSALIGPAQAQVKTGPAKAGPPVVARPIDLAIITRWAVSYGDTQLGDIHGTAYVNWNAEHAVQGGGATQPIERTGHARIVMEGTYAGKQFVANRIEIVEGKITSVRADLEGLAVSSPPTTPPDVSKYPTIAASDGESASITVGGFEKKILIRDKAVPEAGHMHVALAESNFGFLAGEWTYLSDPLTERDRNGQGSVGVFRMLGKEEIADLNAADEPNARSGGFLGLQSGRVAWTPLPTRIADIVPVEDQLEYRNGVPRYAAPTGNRWRSEEAGHRTLLVIGRNLPIDLGKPLAPIEADKLAVREAHVIATSQDRDLSAANKQLFDKGWNEILSELAAKGLKTTREEASRGMDQVLVSVTLNTDAFAGPKRFAWGGSQFRWLLQFGDNTVVSYLVRPLREGKGADENETEAASEFYLPERVAVEVRSRNALGFDTIPVVVGVASGSRLALLAHRQPDDSTLYRTEYFQIGGGGIQAKNGAVLEAAVDQQKLLTARKFQFVAIPLVKASLRTTPASDQPDRLGGLWKEALVRAAKADDLSADNLDAVQSKPAAKALPPVLLDGNTTIKPGAFNKVHVLVRDQAAMLLLRDAFLTAMEKQLAWLQQVKSDSDLEKFREWIRPFVLYEPAAYFGQPQEPYGPNGYVKYPSYPSYLNYVATISAGPGATLATVLLSSDARKDAALKAIDDLNAQLGLIAKVFKAIPGAMLNPNGRPSTVPVWVSAFGRMAVTGFDGVPTTLHQTFANEDRDVASAGPDWYNVEKLRLWHAQVAREALATYEKAVAASIERTNAKAILDSDVQGLLKLTGMSFGPIVKQLLPKLMQLKTLRQGNLVTGVLWVPDISARAAVLNLNTTAEAVRAEEDYSAIQDQYALLALTGLLSVPVMVSEGALASVVTVAGNTLLWADNSVQEILETHRGQQDVEFEFGSALVLGPERLHQAEIRKTEWYQTLLTVAGQGILNVALPARFDTLPKLALERAAFRGEQIAVKLQAASAQTVHALSPAERADLLAFVETVFLNDAEMAPLSAADVKGMTEVEELNYEARGPPPVVEDAETAAPFRAGEQSAADETLAKTAGPRTERLSNPGLPYVPEVNEPAANSWVELREGTGSAELELGERLGKGASSAVYEILDARGRSKSFLAKSKVIKFVDDGPFGTPKAQIARMQTANDYLKATRGTARPIEFAEIVEFHPEASRPYIIQERVDAGQGTVFINSKKLMAQIWEGVGHGFPLPYEDICKLFPPEMQEAVPRLFRDLSLNRLGATDLSLPNLYFKKVGNEWIAGILDVDHIVGSRAAADSSYTWGRIDKIRLDPVANGIESVAWDGRVPNGVATFNEKMLEHNYGGNIDNPWVRFDHNLGRHVPVLIDPALVKKYFPRFGTRLEGFQSLPRAPLPDE